MSVFKRLTAQSSGGKFRDITEVLYRPRVPYVSLHSLSNLLHLQASIVTFSHLRYACIYNMITGKNRSTFRRNYYVSTDNIKSFHPNRHFTNAKQIIPPPAAQDQNKKHNKKQTDRRAAIICQINKLHSDRGKLQNFKR